MLKVLHTADWHLDLSNLEFTESVIKVGLDTPHDLLVHAGDLVVNRSHVHPHVAWKVRELIEFGKGRLGSIVIAGNHDQSFQEGRVGMVEGILKSEASESLVLASGPMIHCLRHQIDADVTECGDFMKQHDDTGTWTAFVLVPTPNKYWLKAKMESGEDPAGLLATMVQGMIARAREGGVSNVAVVYHGTVTGTMLSDEIQMPSGVDIALPHNAFSGADIVLAGHVHKAQVLRSAILPPVYYAGAVAPLTWNDRKMEPVMWMHTFTPNGVSSEQIKLPVVSQMIHTDIDVDETFTGDITNMIMGTIDTQADPIDRLRVRVRGPGAILDAICMDRLVGRNLKIITERTDSVVSRMNIETGFTIPDALELWLDLKQVPQDSRADILALARAIESDVQDYHLDARYEMKPLRLSLRNWCQWETADLDFDGLGGLTLIDGPNYVGKSNLSRAILFALFKKQVAGNRLADLIRKGEDKMSVVLDFKSGERTYRISREVKRGTDGSAQAQLYFMAQMNGDWTPLAEGNARETQAAIERLVGPLDLFLATSFAGQNAVDALLDLTPSELKDTLMSVLQRDFEGRLKIAKMGDAEARAEINELQSAISALSESVVRVTTEQVATAAKRADADRDTLKQIEDLSVAAYTELALAETSSKNLEDLVERLTAANKSKAGAAADLKIAESRHGQAVIARDRLQDARGALQPEPDVLAAQSNAQRVRAHLEAVREAATRQVAEIVAQKEEFAGQVSRLGQEVVTSGHQAERIEADLERAEHSADLMDGVPCGGRSWENVDMSACRFLADARTAKDGLPQMKVDLAAAKKRHNYLSLDHEQAKKHLMETLAREERLNARHKQDAQEIEKELHGWVTIMTDAATVVRANQAKRDEIVRLEMVADELDARLDDVSAKGRVLQDAELAYDKLVLQHADAHRVHTDLTAKRTEAEITHRALAQARNDLEVAVAELAGLQAGLKQSQELAGRIADLTKQMDEARHRAKIADIYCCALHRDGLPFLLLEQYAIPGLKTWANKYLQNTGLSLEVESEHELVGGDLRNNVEITFTDHRGRHPIGAASGFQRTAIGVAMRNALADLLAEGTGSHIHLAVQDEGFGTMDPDNLEAAKGTIRAIADRRGCFIVISHVPGMNAVADSVIHVTDIDGVSSLEVV